MTTTDSIRQHILRLPQAQPVSSKAFLNLGSRAAVDQALTRLVQKGELHRVARGIYMRPKLNPYVGEVAAEPAQVAQAIAAATGSAIQVHGAEAVRQMGLSTQVPTRNIYYTSGPSRHVQIGQMELELKHVAPRKIAMAERPAGIALTALWYLGKEAVTVETLEQVRSRLPRKEFEVLQSATALMPGWMNEVFAQHKAQHTT